MRLPRLAFLSLLVPLAAAATPARAGVAWTGTSLPLVDPRLERPEPVPESPSGEMLPLPFPVAAGDGGTLTHVRVDPAGRLRLGAAAPAADPLRAGEAIAAGAAPWLVLEPLIGAEATPDTRVVWQARDDVLVVRWLDLEAAGGRASVEVLVHRTGAVRYQYWSLPPGRHRAAAAGPDGPIAVGAPAASGSAFDLAPVPAAAPAAGDAGGASGLAIASCAACEPAEPGWLRQLASSGRVCAPRWDANGDGTPDRTGCSCNVAGSACTINCGAGNVSRGLLRSTPATTVDTKWQFDEGTYCRDCPYTFYVLVECGTEMHLPLGDMEGARIRVTEVLTGSPVPVTCSNQAALPGGLWFDGCGTPATRYFWPAATLDNAADPTLPVSWGLASGCQTLAALDANRNGVVDCGSELPTSPGGTIDLATVLPSLSPGEQQVMDCRVSGAQGLCGVYRVDIDSGGYLWELFSNCLGDGSEGFRIFDSCADACAAFRPLPELTVSNVETSDCSGNVDVRFDVTNIGCSDAAVMEYRIETDCPARDSVTGTVPGGLGPSSRVTFTDSILASCPPPFRVTVTIDPLDALAECSETPGAARCNAIPGQDSASVAACGCSALVTPDASTPAPAWCAGSAPPALSAAGSAASGCPGGLEYRWWHGSAGTGTPLTPWQASPAWVPGAEAVPGPNPYTVEVRCGGETCARTAAVSLEQHLPPDVELGAGTSSCGPSVVAFDLTGLGVACAWSTLPPGRIEPGLETACATRTIQLPDDTTVVGTFTDANGCVTVDSLRLAVHPALAVDAGPDRTVCAGAVTTLGGTPSVAGGTAPVGFVWTSSPPGRIAPGEEALPNPSTLALGEPTTFTLEALDVAGCSVLDVVVVDVETPAPPTGLGNSLRAVRERPALAAVWLGWAAGGPEVTGFRLRRGTAKGASHPLHPGAGDLALPAWLDAGAAGSPDDYHYTVAGLNCAGLEGP